MEINKGVQGGKHYAVADGQLAIERNYNLTWMKKHGEKRHAKPYYVRTGRNGNIQFSMSEEEMLEFFAAFLAIKQEYDDADA